MIFNSSEIYNAFSSFSCSVVSNSLQPHESQHARPPCPSPTPGVHSDSYPSSQWCHSAISSSVIPFFSYSQSLPASKSFPMSQLFAWGGQSTGVLALASFLPRKCQGWSPSECTGWISLQSKGLSRVFSNTFRTTKDWSGHVCFESQYWIQCLAQNVIEKLFAWISLCPEKVSGNRHQRLLFWITFHSVTV